MRSARPGRAPRGTSRRASGPRRRRRRSRRPARRRCDRPGRQPVEVVDRAVERVDRPSGRRWCPRWRRPPRRGSRRRGGAARDQLGDQLLGGDVHLGDDVDRAGLGGGDRRGRPGGRRAAARPARRAASRASSSSSACRSGLVTPGSSRVRAVGARGGGLGARGPGSSPPGRGRGSRRARPGRSGVDGSRPLSAAARSSTRSRTAAANRGSAPTVAERAHRQAELRRPWPWPRCRGRT